MANKQFKVPINLVNLASDPGTASEGDIYYNTTSDVVRVYANGAWASVGSGGGSGSDSFKTIAIAGQSDVVADSSTDTLTIIEGNGITITTNANTDAITLGVTSSTYQPLDAELTALAGLTSAADRVPYFTGSGTASLATLTSFGRSLIDDADNTAARSTLGLVIGTDVQAFNATLSGIATFTNSTTFTNANGTTAGVVLTESTSYRTAEYIVQCTDTTGAKYRSSKILVLLTSATTAQMTEYAILESAANAIPINFSVSASGSNVTINGQLTSSPTNTITIKLVRIGLT